MDVRGQEMKIIFNMVKCGLANGGGCQTILRTAMGLMKKGHDVKILLNQPNRFNWFPVPDSLLLSVSSANPEDWPTCDIMMATACSTVNDVNRYNKIPSNQKFFWMRAHETWSMRDDVLLKMYKSFSGNILVNSEWMKQFLYENGGINSEIQYPGLPINEISGIFKEIPFKNKDYKNLIVGALYSEKLRKRFNDVIDISIKAFKNGIVDGLLLFGNEDFKEKYSNELKKVGLEYSYIRQPNMESKIKLMKECDVWLATTDNEGLHIPPMEAALCHCNLVVRGLRPSGMCDYAINDYTAKVFFDNAEAVRCLHEYNENRLKGMRHNNFLQALIEDKIGTVEENVNKLEQKFYKCLGR